MWSINIFYCIVDDGKLGLITMTMKKILKKVLGTLKINCLKTNN